MRTILAHNKDGSPKLNAVQMTPQSWSARDGALRQVILETSARLKTLSPGFLSTSAPSV